MPIMFSAKTWWPPYSQCTFSLTAVFPCPYCETSYKDFQLPLEVRGQGEQRTLDNIRANFHQFSTLGNIDKKQSKKVSKSVVREPLIWIGMWVYSFFHIGLFQFYTIKGMLCSIADSAITRHLSFYRQGKISSPGDFEERYRRVIPYLAMLATR